MYGLRKMDSALFLYLKQGSKGVAISGIGKDFYALTGNLKNFQKNHIKILKIKN
jgi:hypothetical protein